MKEAAHTGLKASRPQMIPPTIEYPCTIIAQPQIRIMSVIALFCPGPYHPCSLKVRELGPTRAATRSPTARQDPNAEPTQKAITEHYPLDDEIRALRMIAQGEGCHHQRRTGG